MTKTIEERKEGAHKTHCCAEHGCKYGDETCPVVLKKVDQAYPCEQCKAKTVVKKSLIQKIEDLARCPESFETRSSASEYYRSAEFKPYGFWSHVIKVTQSKSNLKIGFWDKPVLSWSSGGRDSDQTESDLIASHHFIAALRQAQKIYLEWMLEYEKQENENG